MNRRCKAVINLFGGPGVGKSTIAAGLFFRMKCMHLDVEIIDEYAKFLVYSKRFDVLEKDQIKIFAEQQAKLRIVAEEREFVIVDSPLVLSKIYFNPEKNLADIETFSSLVLQVFNRYPNVNFLVVRNPMNPFEEKGRLQGLEEAKKIDERVETFLELNSIPYTKVLAEPGAVEVILNHLRSSGLIS